MAKFTQKYTLIQLLEEIKEGYEYSSSNWPLHTTIADTFAVDWDKDNLLSRLETLLAKHKSVSTKATDFEFFGPDKQIKVTLLELNEELLELHNSVVSLLKSAGAIFNDPQFTGAGYLPHATVQPHAHLKKGDAITFTGLSLIDMFPNGDPYQRKVLKTMKLLGNS